LHSKQDVEASVKIEVAEVNVSASLKTLVNEGKRWPRTYIRRPIAALCRPGKPVHTFEIQRDKVGHFSKRKLGARAEENAGAKNRPHLRVHAKHEQLRIEGSSGPHPESPTPSFVPDVILDVSNRFWNGRRVCARRLL